MELAMINNVQEDSSYIVVDYASTYILLYA